MPVFILNTDTQKIILIDAFHKDTLFIHSHILKKTSCMTDRENMSERSFVVGGFASFVFISFKFLKVIKKYLDCDFYATLNCIRKGKGAIF